MIFPNKLSKKESGLGLMYLAFSLLILPSLIQLIPMRAGQANFIYYCVNFLAVVLILRRFLVQSLTVALDRPFATLYYGALAFLGYEMLNRLITIVIVVYFPDFFNVNDQGVYTMVREDLVLMTIGTVLLVPVAEECFFRGLLFRGLYDRSPVLAYVLSMSAFSAIHVVGYIGSYDPLQLLLCFVQYLPAGFCLCFAYRRSGTIISPIIDHSVVNALGISSAVR